MLRNFAFSVVFVAGLLIAAVELGWLQDPSVAFCVWGVIGMLLVLRALRVREVRRREKRDRLASDSMRRNHRRGFQE